MGLQQRGCKLQQKAWMKAAVEQPEKSRWALSRKLEEPRRHRGLRTQ